MQKEQENRLLEGEARAILEDRQAVALFDEQLRLLWISPQCPSITWLGFLEEQQELRCQLAKKGVLCLPYDNLVLRITPLQGADKIYYGMEIQQQTQSVSAEMLTQVFERNYRVELSDIFGAVELLRPLLLENPKGNAYLQAIDRSAMVIFRSAQVMSQYLVLSKKEWKKNLVSLGLNETMEKLLNHMQKDFSANGVCVHRDICREDVYIRGDEELLKVILGHLLSNAMQWGKLGGNITVSVSKTKHEAVLTVQNQGEGAFAELDTWYQPHMESALEDNLRSTNGLGLPIVKMAAELLGGRMLCYETSQKDVCVEVRMPLATEKELELCCFAQRLWPDNPSRFDVCRVLAQDGLVRYQDAQKKAGAV